MINLKKPRKIFVCSPLRQGDVRSNIENAKKYAKTIAKNKDIPIVPHLFFTTFLDDNNEQERKLGIRMGIQLMMECDEMYVFNYLSESEGMNQEIKFWEDIVKKPIKWCGIK